MSDASEASLSMDPAGTPGTPGIPADPRGSIGNTAVQEIYATLSRAPGGQALTPSVRAARSLAMAHAHGQTPGTASSRAAAAWATLPVVFRGDPTRPGDSDLGSEDQPPTDPLSDQQALRANRAGRSLQSLVAPSQPKQVSDEDKVRAFFALQERAPTAAPELVRTGSSTEPPAPSGLRGKAQIPRWFQETARQMFSTVGNSEDISLAEMTLVHTAPATQVAASPKSAGQPNPLPQPRGAQPIHEGDPEDIDEIAEQCFSKLMEAMQIARWRNGDPWQRS